MTYSQQYQGPGLRPGLDPRWWPVVAAVKNLRAEPFGGFLCEKSRRAERGSPND